MKSPRPSFTASLALSPMKKELLLKVPKRIQLVNPPEMYTYLFAFYLGGGVFFPFHCKQGKETTPCTIQFYFIYSVTGACAPAPLYLYSPGRMR